MPLSLKIDFTKDIELAVWKITEDVCYFSNKIQFHNDEKSIIERLSKRKLIEWLSSRYLLHIMSGRSIRGAFTKDIHGKPSLENSDFHISISHSQDQVAVIASEKLVGVDIQHYVEKIYRIKEKFVSENEFVDIPKEKELPALHIIWGAKESLYKAYGKRSLDFKKNIGISELDITQDSGKFRGWVNKDDYFKEFEIYYTLYKKYVLVYAKEYS